MATQALISLVKNGKTIVKIIVGCEGQKAEAVVKEIVYNYIPIIDEEEIDINEIYEMSSELGLGCKSCLVVMNETRHIYDGEGLPSIYRETFEDPQFNPRASNGSAEILFIVPI